MKYDTNPSDCRHALCGKFLIGPGREFPLLVHDVGTQFIRILPLEGALFRHEKVRVFLIRHLHIERRKERGIATFPNKHSYMTIPRLHQSTVVK